MRQSILILVLGIVSFCACHTKDKEKSQVVSKPRETIVLPKPIDSIDIDYNGHKRSTYQKVVFEFNSDTTFMSVITHGNIRAATTPHEYKRYDSFNMLLGIKWSSQNTLVLSWAYHPYEYRLYTKHENYAIEHEIVGIIAFDTLTDNFMYQDYRNGGLINIANTKDFKVVAQINMDDYPVTYCSYPCDCLKNIKFGSRKVSFDVCEYNSVKPVKRTTLKW